MSYYETEVLIIGAGVVGAALARELSRYKNEVMLVEKEMDVSFGTSKANSGVVHSGIQEKDGTLKIELCKRGKELYPLLAEELGFHYKKNGAILAARDSGELSKLEKEYQRGIANNIPDLKMIDREELLSLEPNLNEDLVGGLYISAGAIVAPYEVTIALTENSVKNGVRLSLNTEVTGITPDGDDFLVETNQGTIRACYVVNSAGLFSAEIAAMVGDDSYNIYPRRGEEYLLDRRLEGLVKATIFPMPRTVYGKTFKGILAIPTVSGNIMIGPTYDNDPDLRTTAEGWELVYREARELVPAIKPTDLITSFAGLRAGSDIEDFVIKPSSRSPRFINLIGIDSPGLTAAPAIAEYVSQLLQERGLTAEKDPGFDPERRVISLRDLTDEEKASLIEEQPAYGNIVCRCEQVSEGEVRDAIRRGANTLDGVKFRTRAGMGRCQGGFCKPKIIKLLREELSLRPEEVVKNSAGSTLLAGSLREVKDTHEG